MEPMQPTGGGVALPGSSTIIQRLLTLTQKQKLFSLMS